MANKDSLISKELLHQLFEYQDGRLIYKQDGCEAICKDNKGYRRAKIHGLYYFVHRIVFMMHYGYLPKYLDHIDCNRENNRIENLREASLKENCRNRSISSRNKSGIKGIFWAKPNKKWKAQCTVNYKQYHIGYFDSLEDASCALSKFRAEHHLYFARD